MLKFSRFIVPFAAIVLLNGCFASRQTEPVRKIQGIDPVKTTLDTLTLARDKITISGTLSDSVADTLKHKTSDAADEAPVLKNGTVISKIDTCITMIDTFIFSMDTCISVEEMPLSENDTGRSKLDTCVTLVDTVILKKDTCITILAAGISEMDTSEQIMETDILAPPDTVTIIGTGDIMPGTDYPDRRYLPPGNDCSALFRPVADILKSADVTFGNLEGVFSPDGGDAKKCNDPSVCYVFRIPAEYLECILEAGYNLLSVANNHVNDFGYEGRVSSAKILDESGVPYAGFLSRPSVTFEIGGVKYGFAAFAPHLGTVDLKDYRGAARIVEGLDAICDIVIVSFHGGAEGKDYQHVPCTDEVYLGYNRGNVCKFAHTVVDAGADVVFGHGPHVTRAMELYKDRLICYSLGNFCTYARFNLAGPNGIAPIVKVLTNRSGEFLGGEVIPVYQPGQGGPQIDPHKRAISRLRELSSVDFPGNELIIDENGRLLKR
ncbi:MAG: CapA family protein [Bacteroidales bacterium]